MSTQDYITRDRAMALRIQALVWKDGKTIGEALNIAMGAHGFEKLCEVAVEEATKATKADLEIIREVATRNIDRVEKLQAERERVRHEAELLAYGIYSQNFVNDAPDWKPLGDAIGILSQISNMAAGLQTERDTWRRRAEEKEKPTRVLGESIEALKCETAALMAQRDALLEMVWLDGPGKPTESIAEWKAQFEKEWVRRDEAKADFNGAMKSREEALKERDALKTGTDLIAAELADTKRHLVTLREKYDNLELEWRALQKPVGDAKLNALEIRLRILAQEWIDSAIWLKIPLKTGARNIHDCAEQLLTALQ